MTNLGAGLVERVASVTTEERILEYATLSIEIDVFKALTLKKIRLGSNADSMIEMSHAFDFQNCGELEACFLGASQVSLCGGMSALRLSKGMIASNQSHIFTYCIFIDAILFFLVQRDPLTFRSSPQVRVSCLFL